MILIFFNRNTKVKGLCFQFSMFPIVVFLFIDVNLYFALVCTFVFVLKLYFWLLFNYVCILELFLVENAQLYCCLKFIYVFWEDWHKFEKNVQFWFDVTFWVSKNEIEQMLKMPSQKDLKKHIKFSFLSPLTFNLWVGWVFCKFKVAFNGRFFQGQTI